MNTEPEWTTVLRVLYEAGADLDGSSRQSSDGASGEASDGASGEASDAALAAAQYDRIADETGLDDDEITEIVEWLDRQGLVRTTEPQGADATERYAVELEPEGFEVAQEQARQDREAEQGLERNRLQHSFNRAIALLTLGLVTINMFDSAIRITLETENLAVAYVVLALGFGGMIVVLAGLVYTGLLSSYTSSDG